MFRSSICALVFLAAMVGRDCLAAETAQSPGTPELQTERVCVPVQSSRAWSTALAPNGRGGFNFITQLHEFKSGKPSEYVVLDLETGEYRITERPAGQYTNSNYQHGNQARARNGRIFFSEAGNVVAYYDPADESIKELGRVIDPSKGDKFIFKLEFGPDGMLYGSTQANDLPTVVRIDPETLQFKVLGRVGKNRLSYSYGYNLAADPPWVYVGVGQTPWELAAIHADTGESKVLMTCAGAGWIDFDLRKEGIIAKTVSNRGAADEKREVFWCVDGRIVPFDPNHDPAKLPFQPRQVHQARAPVEKPPELNLTELNADSDGVCRVYWRDAGSAGSWKQTTFKINYTSPIAIGSLTALPDGSLLGDTKQYHGFFRYNPKDRSCQAYGAHGPSGGPRLVVSNRVYFCGYPSSVLYEYDPSKPWTSNRLLEESSDATTPVNPTRLGYFAEKTGTHYAYFLIPSKNGRLYFGGRRERTGIGGGVGWYDPATKMFAGHHEKLSFLKPRGMKVVDELQRVIYSGMLQDDPPLPGQAPAEAQLVVYDMELKEVERLSVKPGIKSTGELFPSRGSQQRPSFFETLFGQSDRGQFIGLISEEKAVYRYDLAWRRLLAWASLPDECGPTTQKPSDGSIWTICGGVLVRIDSRTLKCKPIGRFANPVTLMTWLGDDLTVATGTDSGYTAGAELHKVTLPRRGTGAPPVGRGVEAVRGRRSGAGR
jgi:hypothetical protein